MMFKSNLCIFYFFLSNLLVPLYAEKLRHLYFLFYIIDLFITKLYIFQLILACFDLNFHADRAGI